MIKTVSFISYSTSKNELSVTYPISIGLKASNQNAIKYMFAQECNELAEGKNNMFYYMRQRKYWYVHFEIIVSLEDQLARRSNNYVMLSNSIFLPDMGMLPMGELFGVTHPHVLLAIMGREKNTFSNARCKFW